MLIFNLDPAQNHAILTLRCVHFTFCGGRELMINDERVLPVTKKERKGKGKWTIGPRMKNRCANFSPSTKK